MRIKKALCLFVFATAALIVTAVIIFNQRLIRPPSAPSEGGRLSITELKPDDGAAFESFSVLVTFETNVPADARLTLRRIGQVDAKTLAAPAETKHRIELTQLVPGCEYVFSVEATAAGETARSDERRFTVARLQALVFEEHNPAISIRRDYDQRAAIGVKNIDNREHAVRLVAVDVPPDLTVGILGPGSEDLPAPRLAPGEVRNYRLMLYAPEAVKRQYSFKLLLRNMESQDADSYFDTATIDVPVQFPAFDVKLRAEGEKRDPSTLALPVTIANDGEDISDLTLAVSENLKNLVEILPSFDSFPLARGKSAQALVVPILSPDFMGARGELVAKGAGQEVRLPIAFERPPGKNVYLAFGGSESTISTDGGGCTNKGRHDMHSSSNSSTGKTDTGDFTFNARHRIVRKAVLEYLPDLVKESRTCPSRCARSSFTYKAWHEPAGEGQQIFVDSEPYPNKPIPLTADRFLNQWPDLLVLPDGRLLVVWERHHPDGNVEIVVSRTGPLGANVSPPTVVSPRKPGLANPVLASAGTGEICAVWQDTNALAIRSTLDGGESWSEAREVCPDPAVVMSWQQLCMGRSGARILVYRGESQGTARIYSSSLAPDGFTWGRAVPVSGAGDVGEPSAVVLPSGRALVAWRNGADAIQGSYSTDDGKTWSASQPLAQESPFAELPQLSVDERGTISLSWLKAEGNRIRKASREINDGFTTLAVNEDPLDAQMESVLARCAQSLGGGEGVIASARSVSDGGFPVALNENSFEQPFIIKTGAATHFLWHRTYGGNGRILYAAIGPDHKFSRKPCAINPPGVSGAWPAAALLSNGDLAAYYVATSGPDAGRIVVQTVSTTGTASSPRAVSEKPGGSVSVCARENRVAVSWLEGDALVVVEDGTPQRVATGCAATPAALAYAADGLLMVACSRSDGSLAVLTKPNRHAWEKERILAPVGRSPAFGASPDGETWMAYGNEKGIAVRKSKDGVQWSESEQAVEAKGYARLPSVLAVNAVPRLAFHAPSVNETGTIDSLFLTSRSNGAWSEPVRTFSLQPNIRRMYLTMNFGLKHERTVYRSLDSHILLNGHLAGSIMNRIPEGRYIFPVAPEWASYAIGNAVNRYTFLVSRINASHYILAYNIRLITDYSFTEKYIFAATQAEADAEWRKVQTGINHDKPDIGIYANEMQAVPASPLAGSMLELPLLVANTGARASEGVRVAAFAELPVWSSGAFAGKLLAGPKDLGTVAAGDWQRTGLSFPCPAGLQRVYTAVWSAGPDLTMENNVQATTFAVRPEESPFANLDASDRSPRAEVRLDILVGDEKVPAGDLSVAFFPAGNRFRPAFEADGSGTYSVRPFTYDVRVRYLKSNDVVEQWLQGMKVVEGKGSAAKVVLPVSSLEFEFANPLKLALDVQIWPAGTRGASRVVPLDSGKATQRLRLGSGRYDLRIRTRNGPPALEQIVEGVELLPGRTVKVPIVMKAGALSVPACERRSRNAFNAYITVFDKSQPPKLLVSNRSAAQPLALPAGVYDVCVTHPFLRGVHGTLEERHTDVTIAEGTVTPLALSTPLATLRVTTQDGRGGPILQVPAALYRKGDYTQPVYSFSCDDAVAVVRGEYDLCCMLSAQTNWVYGIDLTQDRTVNVAVQCGSILFQVHREHDGELVNSDLRFLITPREMFSAGSRKASGLEADYSIPRDGPQGYIFSPGSYDVRTRATGYGTESQRWTQNIVVQPNQQVTLDAKLKLGTLQVVPSDQRIGGLDAEVFLYPAGDQVNRIINRAQDRPIRLNEMTAVTPGSYDIYVRFPQLGPAFDQRVRGALINAGQTVTATVPLSTGAVSLTLTQRRGVELTDGVEACFERVGSSPPGARSERLIDAGRGPVALLEGFYDLTPALDGIVIDAARQRNVEIVAGSLVERRLEIEAGEVAASVRLPDGSRYFRPASVMAVPVSEGLSGTSWLPAAFGTYTSVLPVGEYRIVAEMDGQIWLGRVTVAGGKLSSLEITIDASSIAVTAKRAGGGALRGSAELFVPGDGSTMVAKADLGQTLHLHAGTYDAKVVLDTGEVQWVRGITAKPGAQAVPVAEFPAANLVVAAADPAMNVAGSGYIALLFPKGGQQPMGWCALGEGACVPPGTYDILISSSTASRDGLWTRGIEVKESRRVELPLEAGFLCIKVSPQLQDAKGDPAVGMTVFKENSSEIVARDSTGREMVLPAGTYDVLLSYDGPGGKFEEQLKGLAVRKGISTAKVVSWLDRAGSIRTYIISGNSSYFPLTLTVLQNGQPFARYADQSTIPLLPGRYSLSLETRGILNAEPIGVPEMEVYREIERSLDVPLSIGRIAIVAPGPIRKAKIVRLGRDESPLLETWSNRMVAARAGTYDVWIDSIGWIRNVCLTGGQTIVVGNER